MNTTIDKKILRHFSSKIKEKKEGEEVMDLGILNFTLMKMMTMKNMVMKMRMMMKKMRETMAKMMTKIWRMLESLRTGISDNN